MDSASPKILRFLNDNLVREQQRMMQQQPIAPFNDNNPLCGVVLFGNVDLGLGELMVGRAMKPEPGVGNWENDDFGRILKCGNLFERSCALPGTASCPPPEAATGGDGKEAALSSATGGDIGLKKRKTDNLKAGVEEKLLAKKVKPCTEKDSKITEDNGNNNNSNHQKEPSKENSKGSEVPKPDYIHVRARRGQATDSHSLAERVRRKRISTKMKYLQDLVPGCNKITRKADVLDEIINYVQSLQRKVEILSMELAAVTPRLDFGVEDCVAKEMFSACATGVPTMDSVSLFRQGVLSSGLEMDVNASDLTLRRAISDPVCILETGPESSCWNQRQHIAWDAGLQNPYSTEFQQGRSAPFISLPFTELNAGFVEAGHVKLEEM